VSRASIAARHSGASCSFFGSPAMYSPGVAQCQQLAAIYIDRILERPTPILCSQVISQPAAD
jgi:hypothetical protein